MKKIIGMALTVLVFFVGCAGVAEKSSVKSSVPTSQLASLVGSAVSAAQSKTLSEVSEEQSDSSEVSFAVSVDFTALSGKELYMACLEVGKFDIYNLKIGDFIKDGETEFGIGEFYYYGLGADCFDYGEVIVVFVEEEHGNKVCDIEIEGKGITVFGLTTGKSKRENVRELFGEPDFSGHFSYENRLSEELNSDGEKYDMFSYRSKSDIYKVSFFFENGVLEYISMGKAHLGS